MRVRFGEFTFDRARRKLLRQEDEVHLEPLAFDLLALLIERRPDVVTKAEIRDRLGTGAAVSDSILTRLVAEIREALRDDRRQSHYIQTVRTFGYAFWGAAPEPDQGRPAAPQSPRVIWGGRVIPLRPGENVIGRDEDAAVRIDEPGVSRRHARIVVDAERVLLEDLGSRNGTFLGEQRLGRPWVLADGDAFRLGRQLLLYRSSPLRDAAESEGEPG